eukprot:6198982-Pleurochrysis_carterae.AAC.1
MLSSCNSVSVRASRLRVILRPMNLSTQAKVLLLPLEALAIGCCKLVEEVFVIVDIGDGEVVNPNNDKEQHEPSRLKRSALGSTFKCHLQLANELLRCRLVVLFKAFHLLK